MRLRSLHRAYPSLHPSGVVHWVPEQLNIKAVTGACKLIDGCSFALCSTTVSVISAGICHRIKSIQLHDSIVRLSQKIVSFTLHYMYIPHTGFRFFKYLFSCIMQEIQVLYSTTIATVWLQNNF